MMVNWLRGGGLKRENISKYRSQLTLFIFSLIFISVITISTKKSGVRYMLPLWPFFYIASVWAINKLLVKLDVRKIVINTIFAVFFLVGVYNYSLYYSSYDYYYNALFGGAKSVQNHVLVGLCYGAQETSNYIKKCYPQVTSFDYIGCSKTVVPYYFSGNLTDDWLNSSLVAIEESYRILGYQKDIIEYLDNKTEGKIIEKNGAILSRIYLNDSNLQNACDL